MKISVKPIVTDVTLYASYKESLLRLIEDPGTRVSLIGKLQSAFALRLDDIKINRESPSGNYFHCVKVYGTTLFDVSFGLEEVTTKILRAEGEKQILDLYGRLFQVLDELPISVLRFSIGHQLSVEENSELFLTSLNPDTPEGFKNILTGRGVQYNLQMAQHNLNIYVSLASSLFYNNAIFLSIDSHFSPYTYDFQTLSKIVMENYSFSLRELGIEMRSEG